MEGLKRTIPRVAAASLVFGGTSCSATTPELADIADGHCRGVQHCDPAYFSTTWDTGAECAAEYIAGGEMYSEGSDACERASLVLEACFNDEYYGSCDVLSALAACEQEQEKKVEACETDP
jgi:hypothetical protein